MDKEIKMLGTSSRELTSNAKEFYQNYWTEGTQVSERTRLHHHRVLKMLFPDGVKGCTVLEIGIGGQGGIVLQLKDHNAVFGLDASATAQKNCEKLGLNVQVANLDMERIPFQDRCFDIVFAFEVFEHFGNPQFVIEEIRRVLKHAGTLVLSTPNPMIHHWPRLFYPGLFQEKAFKEFIMINRFEVIQKINLYSNSYAPFLNDESSKAWSWIWYCKNTPDQRPDLLYEYGNYFWDQENELGIRTCPMEAIDMFRASYELDRSNVDALFCLTRALVYRLINGEDEEFTYYYKRLMYYTDSDQYPDSMKAMYHAALLFLELKVFNIDIMDESMFITLFKKLSSLPESQHYIDIIKWKINRIRKMND
jgi:ubiquinone/menaquinone biosynthesis C-methylase UbiE